MKTYKEFFECQEQTCETSIKIFLRAVAKINYPVEHLPPADPEEFKIEENELFNLKNLKNLSNELSITVECLILKYKYRKDWKILINLALKGLEIKQSINQIVFVV
jgi:hypothetical protein